MLITLLAFILVLSVLVLVHEAGHFFVAKWMGIKVEEFGFGFPPRVFGKKFGETVYSINALPIGGFVKLFGEDEAGGGSIRIKQQASSVKKDRRSFISRNPWQRAAIVVAGVVMNFILAVVILSYMYGVHGVPTPGKDVYVAGVAKGSPAAAAGLKEGEKILSVNSVQITSTEQVISYTKNHLGEKLTVVVQEKNGKKNTLFITPRVKYPANQGPMGVVISQNVSVKKYPWYEAPYIGLRESLKTSWMIVQGLGTIIVQLITQHSVPADVAGPIGIAQLTGQTVKYGFDAVLSLVALLSLNLAIMNVLPIPALDGGRLFFILIEGVTGKKVSPKVESYTHSIGMAVLLFLILLITFHDLFRVFTGQSLLPK
jgi:regulator of sigma E protease